MTSITDTMDALKSAGLRDEVAILVGGAPVNQAFADEIDADGYADNAGDAVDRVKELIK
jgi:5-methyltetrahydrofolate--homocysteine methyltransferase